MILNEQELKKAQMIMLMILKKFVSMCEENGIAYFLHGGTLLGAVRHDGFIPWDDDIDVGMLREDYDKFRELLEKENSDFVLQNYDTDEGFGFPFSKLVLKETKWIENFAKNTDRKFQGIYLDIFPFDKVPNNERLQKKIYKRIKILRAIIHSKQNYDSQFSNKLKCIIFKSLRIFTKPINVKYFQEKQIKLSLKYRKLTEDYSITYFGGDFFENINPEIYFTDLVKHKFEDTEFYISKEYDKILTKMYGDYMTPPEDKSYKHQIIEYDFGPYNY